jgi:hypothetical protein
MNTYRFEISATLADVASVPDAGVRLGAALAKAGDVVISRIEQTEALGMTRKEIVLSIIISFTTSIAATEATDLIKSLLKNVHTTAVLHVDVTYDSSDDTKATDGATSSHSHSGHPSNRTVIRH